MITSVTKRVSVMLAVVLTAWFSAIWFGYGSGYESAVRYSVMSAAAAGATDLEASPDTTCWRMRPDGSWSMPWRGRGGVCFSADEVH